MICRRLSEQHETFSPQVDAHSRKLAEAVYEQTQGLGPTPLQGRLNYLHQLGKVTLRDRQLCLENLPRQREEVEFAVSLQCECECDCECECEWEWECECDCECEFKA